MADPQQQPNGAAPAPAGQSRPDELPAWLTKIPGVDVESIRNNKDLAEEIRGGWLRQDDYTRKTQEIAPYRKARERLGNRDLEQELSRLEQYDGWREQTYPAIEQRLQRLDQLEQQIAQASQQAQPQPGQRRGRVQMSPDDLFEQERLNNKVAELEQGFVESANQQWRDWYYTQEIPRLDRVSGNYLATVLGLMNVIWPQDKPSISALLRESVASQEPNMRRVAERIIQGATSVKQAGYDEGYQRGVKEAQDRLKGSQSPPPSGYGAPSWKRPPEAPRKGDRNGLRESVLREIEQKHGALPR
jgi:methylphosphotriester-DNA--protein-cysteine methyltransferase